MGDLELTAETITDQEIRWVREFGPRTVEYLNATDMALAARRGEFGAGRPAAERALAFCAEYFNAKGPREECGRCRGAVHRSWDHLNIGEHGEFYTCAKG